ncbi:VanZ family protein [Waltera intestinalis]|uniref:VanZ family protein n=1 Tax=Waltera intestinalis TaxID=2606635 RepID=A0A6L5YJ77_9FIRM|nr:VanZ family protein [Waltera intestinalis]MST58325.1 VanZ family protein [Waltera intestinalis]
MQMLKKVFSPTIMERALEQFGSVSIEKFLLYSLVGVLIFLLVVIVRRILGKATSITDIMSGIVCIIYLSIMLQLTLVCRESGSRIGIDLDLFHGLRGPDNDFHWLMVAYVILNCLLFIPYGFTLSLFSFVNERKSITQMVLVLLISFASSMIIEIAQLITQRGYYELQDLLFNTLGGVIGWGIFYIIYRVGTFIYRRREEK